MYVENQPTAVNQQKKDTSYAALIHLSSFLGLFVSIFSIVLIPFIGIFAPLIGIFTPLILWLIKKDEDIFVDKHGKSCLNFEISIFIYNIIITFVSIIGVVSYLVSTFGSSLSENDVYTLLEENSFSILTSSVVGGIFFLFFLVLIFLFYVIVKIKAAIRASNGKLYKYPLAIPFFKI